MGSPLAPLLANWFVSDLESNLLEKHQQPKIYCRYVDDIFCVFNNENQTKDFNAISNNLHKDMCFTMEISKSNQLPYLDINVNISEDKFLTSIYKKS